MSLKVKQSINMSNIAIALMCVYVFFSYNALDIAFSRYFNSITLYMFIVYSALFYIVSLGTKNKPSVNIYTVWYFLFITLSLFSMLYSPEKSLMSGSFYLMIVSLIVTFFFIFIVKTERIFELLGISYFLSSVVLVLTLIITGNINSNSSERLGEELMGNANTFAIMICTAVMYGMWLLLFKGYRKFTKAIILVCIILDYYALALSGGRRSFVIPLIFLFVVVIVKANAISRLKVIKYSIITTFLIVGLFYAVMHVDVLYESIGIRFEGLINGITGDGVQDNSSRIRDELKKLAFNGWLEAPLIGHGFDSFKYLAEQNIGQLFYSHCNFTEILYNNGLIGFILYYSIYAVIFAAVLKRKNVHIKYRAFVMGTLIAFLISDYGGVFYNTFITQQMLAMCTVVLKFKANDSQRLINE